MNDNLGVSKAGSQQAISTDYDASKDKVADQNKTNKLEQKNFYGKGVITVDAVNYVKNSKKSFLSHVGNSKHRVSRADAAKKQLFLKDDVKLNQEDFSYIQNFLTTTSTNINLDEANQKFSKFVNSIPYYINNANQADYADDADFISLPVSSAKNDASEQKQFFNLFYRLETALDSPDILEDNNKYKIADTVVKNTSNLLAKMLRDTCKHKSDATGILHRDNIFYNLRNISKSIIQITQKCSRIGNALASDSLYDTVFDRVTKSDNPEEVKLLNQIIKNEGQYVAKGVNVLDKDSAFLFPLLKTLRKGKGSRLTVLRKAKYSKNFTKVYDYVKKLNAKNTSDIIKKEAIFKKYMAKTGKDLIETINLNLKKISGCINKIDKAREEINKYKGLDESEKQIKNRHKNAEKTIAKEEEKIVKYFNKAAPNIKYFQYIYNSFYMNSAHKNDFTVAFEDENKKFTNLMEKAIEEYKIEQLGTLEYRKEEQDIQKSYMTNKHLDINQAISEQLEESSIVENISGKDLKTDPETDLETEQAPQSTNPSLLIRDGIYSFIDTEEERSDKEPARNAPAAASTAGREEESNKEPAPVPPPRKKRAKSTPLTEQPTNKNNVTPTPKTEPEPRSKIDQGLNSQNTIKPSLTADTLDQLKKVESVQQQLKNREAINYIDKFISNIESDLSASNIKKQNNKIAKEAEKQGAMVSLGLGAVTGGNLLNPQAIPSLKNKKGVCANAAHKTLKEGDGLCGQFFKAVYQDHLRASDHKVPENLSQQLSEDCKQQCQAKFGQNSLPPSGVVAAPSYDLEKKGVLFTLHGAAPNLDKQRSDAEAYLSEHDDVVLQWLVNTYKDCFDTANNDPLGKGVSDFVAVPLFGGAIFKVPQPLIFKAFFIATLLSEDNNMEKVLFLHPKINEKSQKEIAQLSAVYEKLQNNTEFNQELSKFKT